MNEPSSQVLISAPCQRSLVKVNRPPCLKEIREATGAYWGQGEVTETCLMGQSLVLTLVWVPGLPPPLIQNLSSAADLSPPVSNGPLEGVLAPPVGTPSLWVLHLYRLGAQRERDAGGSEQSSFVEAMLG